MRSRPLLIWYALILLMLLEILVYWASGQVAALLQQRQWEEFSLNMSSWQPAGEVPYKDQINKSAMQYGVSARLVSLVIEAESSFNPRAVSKAGAYGLMQVIPGTWQQVNKEFEICKGRHAGGCSIDCYQDPELNIGIGTAYLSKLLQRFNANAVLAVAAYNAGPGAVDRYGGIPPFQETQEYVERIVNNWSKTRPSSGKSGLGSSKEWNLVRNKAGWALLLTALVAVMLGRRLYRRKNSWRWR